MSLASLVSKTSPDSLSYHGKQLPETFHFWYAELRNIERKFLMEDCSFSCDLVSVVLFMLILVNTLFDICNDDSIVTQTVILPRVLCRQMLQQLYFL